MNHLALTPNCKLHSTEEESQAFQIRLFTFSTPYQPLIKPATSAEVDRNGDSCGKHSICILCFDREKKEMCNCMGRIVLSLAISI